MFAIKIPAADLKEKIGHQITHMDVCTYNMSDPYMEIIIFCFNDKGELEVQGITAIGESAEVPIEGQQVFEFTGEPIIIRPETDYYAAAKFMGQIGAQASADSSNNGKSNLIWDDTQYKFLTIKDLGLKENYDWQISMFSRFREIDPVSSITISPVYPDLMACAGIEYPLSAVVAPTTAAYSNFEWSSSDTEIATIDENGTATLLKDGKVTFYATSTKYPDVKGEFQLNVLLNQGTEGTVIDSDGNRVSGANLTFYPLSVTKSQQNAMQQISYTRTSESGVKAKTNSSGEFYAELPEGTYEVEAKKDGLMDYQGVVTIGYGLNNTQLMMYQYVETLSDFMCYTDPQIANSIGDESYNFVPYTLWTAEDLKGHVGESITRFKAVIAGSAHVRFVVFTPEADKFIYRSELIEVADGSLEMVVHDIPAASYITIEEGADYCIGYEVADYDQELAPAIISSPANTISGKSDCVVYRGELTDLTTLSGGPVGSWIMGFYLQDVEQQKGLSVSVGQHDAVATWNPGSYTEFRLSYGVEGQELQQVELDDCKFEFTDLEVATTYAIEVEGKNSFGEYVEILSSTFTTLAQKTTIPLVQLKAYNGYAAGEVLNLKTINTQSTDQVEWFVDSERINRNTVLLTAGKHKIQCRVTRGLQVFVTTRYINVESKKQ